MANWQPIATAPRDDGEVLLYDPSVGVRIGHRWMRDEWEALGGGLLEPTHWMPLPEPPTNGNGQ